MEVSADGAVPGDTDGAVPGDTDGAVPGDGVGLPVPSGELLASPLAPLTDARAATIGATAGARLARLRAAAPQLAADIVASGQPSGVTTGDLSLRGHPAEAALDGAPRSPAPVVWLTHRMLVVQWDDDGHTRTLLWCPTDEVATARPGDVPRRLRRGGDRRLGTVLGHVRALGIDPAHVDLLAFPDLRGQDVRRWLGTTRPAPDLGSPDEPLTPHFPSAHLAVARAEWEALDQPHPLERAAYRSEAFRDLPGERVVGLDGDVLLGPGVALVATPGRTAGTTSLVLHTEGGLWVASANGVAADCWAPRASRIPGLRHHAVERARDVIPHRTAGGDATAQHDAMVVERLLAAPRDEAPFPRCYPAAELTRDRRAPGIRPSTGATRLTHGLVRGDRVLAARATSA